MNADWQNKLYFGDNLDILREYVAAESVDLIYLDPPFNSKATYNVLFKEKNGSDGVPPIPETDGRDARRADCHGREPPSLW